MCGSLGASSANQMALDVAIEHVTSERGHVDVITVPIGSVPMLDPACGDDPPREVAFMRSALEAADGVLLATPEYAGGLAGGMKNALDWLVGSASIHHRPIAVLSAGTTGGVFAIDQLVRTLSWQGALTVATLGITAPKTKIEPGVGFTDLGTVGDIVQWTDRLIDAILMDPAALKEQVASVVMPFGIDPARFGELR